MNNIHLSREELVKIIDDSLDSLYEAKLGIRTASIEDATQNMAIDPKSGCKVTLKLPIPAPGTKAPGGKTYGKLAQLIFNNQHTFVYAIGLILDTVVGIPNQICGMVGKVSDDISKQKGWSLGEASKGGPKSKEESPTSKVSSNYTITESGGSAQSKLFPGMTACRGSTCTTAVRDSEKAFKNLSKELGNANTKQKVTTALNKYGLVATTSVTDSFSHSSHAKHAVYNYFMNTNKGQATLINMEKNLDSVPDDLTNLRKLIEDKFKQSSL